MHTASGARDRSAISYDSTPYKSHVGQSFIPRSFNVWQCSTPQALLVPPAACVKACSQSTGSMLHKGILISNKTCALGSAVMNACENVSD